MTAVFDHSESTGSDRLVLLVIADRANDDGTGCYRGKDSIARMARVSRSTVTRSIANLVRLGELQVEHRDGRTSVYRITLNPAQIEHGAETDGAQDEPTTHVTGEPTPGSTVSRDPSSEPSEEPSAARAELPVDQRLVNAWWESFEPRPGQPYPAVLKIVRAALKLGWTPTQIHNGLRDCVPPLTAGMLDGKLRRRYGAGRLDPTDPSGLR